MHEFLKQIGSTAGTTLVLFAGLGLIVASSLWDYLGARTRT